MKRTRQNPLTTFQERKLISTYCLLWYNSTKSYSQIFKLCDPVFKTYSGDVKLRWKTGSSILVSEGNSKHLATVLAIGNVVKVKDFEVTLACEIHSDYDTESALALAEKCDNSDSGHSDSDDSDTVVDEEGSASSETGSTSTKLPEREPAAVLAKKKRQELIVKEGQKQKALQAASTKSKGLTNILGTGPSIVLASNDSANANGDSSTISGVGVGDSQANSAISIESDLEMSEPAKPSLSTDYVTISKCNFDCLNAKMDSLIKIFKHSNNILKEIRDQNQPAAETNTEMLLPAFRGGHFCVDDITAEARTHFALQCVERMKGPDYIRLHRFEQNVKASSGLTLADHSLIKLLKDALRARFGQSHWRTVRLALNQASRDRAAKFRRQSGNMESKD